MNNKSSYCWLRCFICNSLILLTGTSADNDKHVSWCNLSLPPRSHVLLQKNLNLSLILILGIIVQPEDIESSLWCGLSGCFLRHSFLFFPLSLIFENPNLFFTSADSRLVLWSWMDYWSITSDPKPPFEAIVITVNVVKSQSSVKSRILIHVFKCILFSANQVQSWFGIFMPSPDILYNVLECLVYDLCLGVSEWMCWGKRLRTAALYSQCEVNTQVQMQFYIQQQHQRDVLHLQNVAERPLKVLRPHSERTTERRAMTTKRCKLTTKRQSYKEI